MTKQNIKKNSIIVTYGDGNNNIIAVCTKTLLKDGSIKYELYKTDNNLSSFEYLTSSANPYDFDKVLYKNYKSNNASKTINVIKDSKSSKISNPKPTTVPRQSKKLF